MSGQKLGHQVKYLEKHVYTLETTDSVQNSWKLVRMFVFIIAWTCLKNLMHTLRVHIFSEKLVQVSQKSMTVLY